MRRGWRIYVKRRKNNTVEPSLTATSVIRSPCYYGQFFRPDKTAIHFLTKKKPLMRLPVNTANGHILQSLIVESIIISPR